MKIMPNKHAFQEGYLKQKSTPFAFEKALLDAIHNKMSDDTGGLYYSEHLESLQQSHLNFDIQKVVNTQNHGEATSEVAFEKSIRKETVSIDAKIPLTKHLIEKNGLSQASFEPAFYKTRDHSFASSVTPTISINNASQKIEDTPKIPKAVLEKAFKTCTHYKNHSLFIKNGQVELTLNLQNTHPLILKPLLMHIKTWLANNHLRLRKFILNGVQK